MLTRIIPDKDGKIGTGVKFERIRRITGYLVGDLDRFCNSKRAEESQRVKHMTTQEQQSLACHTCQEDD